MSWIKKYLYLFPVLFYLPALGNFFSSDDWFHLRITQIDSLQQFINFFSFTNNPQSASFYRPLSTQVYFFIFQKIFGLTALPYYLFGLILFSYILYLIRKLSKIYLPSTVDYLPSIIYGLSVSNFTRVYFISAFQELFLVVFSLLTIINFKERPKLSLLFFALALMSKETAIILPVLILLLNYKYIKNNFQSLRPAIYGATILSVVYLNYRLLYFGLAQGVSYVWDFSPVKALNTFMWYSLWSLGAPELLVDYIGSGLRPIPRFFTDYQSWWSVIIFPLVLLVISLACLFLSRFKKLNSQFWYFTLFFTISLLPFLFLPSHKFALELGLPLVGFSVALSIIFSNISNILNFCILVLFIFYNLSMNYLTYTRHYSVSRGQISQKVYQYFSQNYPTSPDSGYFEFINDTKDNGLLWGQSKQISQSLSRSDFFKVFYQKPDYKVYYEDTNEQRPSSNGLEAIKISTKQFLNP